MAKSHKIAILTCVSNVMGAGPGHSAVVAYDSVYSFETVPWQNTFNDGWNIFKIGKYLEHNAGRPVVIQELTQLVDLERVMRRVRTSMQNDDDYLGLPSGVCSTQVARALNAGTVQKFDPKGIDTPYGVFKHATALGLVNRSYYYWPGKFDIHPTAMRLLGLEPGKPIDGEVATALLR